MCIHNIMEEVKIGDRRFKMIDGKICIVRFNRFSAEVKSGKFSPIKFHDNGHGYKAGSVTVNGRKTDLLEHRLIWKLAYPDWDIFDTSPDNFIDHYNRDRSDNRLENLHVVNNQQNSFNRSDVNGYFLRPSGRYAALLKVDGVKKCLGTFDTEEEAHTSYLQAKLKYHVIV